MSSSLHDPFFQGGEYGGKTTMEADGLFVTFHMPEALRSRQGIDGEVAQALPPYKPRSAFQVDDYPAAPEQWLRSSAGVSSYMVAVKPEHGCWLDFNANARHNSQQHRPSRRLSSRSSLRPAGSEESSAATISVR